MKRTQAFRFFSLYAAIFSFIAVSSLWSQSSELVPVRGLASCELGDESSVFPDYSFQGGSLFQMMNSYREKFQATDFELSLAQMRLNDYLWQSRLQTEYQKQYLGLGVTQAALTNSSNLSIVTGLSSAPGLVAHTDIWSNIGIPNRAVLPALNEPVAQKQVTTNFDSGGVTKALNRAKTTFIGHIAAPVGIGI